VFTGTKPLGKRGSGRHFPRLQPKCNAWVPEERDSDRHLAVTDVEKTRWKGPRWPFTEGINLKGVLLEGFPESYTQRVVQKSTSRERDTREKRGSLKKKEPKTPATGYVRVLRAQVIEKRRDTSTNQVKEGEVG